MLVVPPHEELTRAGRLAPALVVSILGLAFLANFSGGALAAVSPTTTTTTTTGPCVLLTTSSTGQESVTVTCTMNEPTSVTIDVPPVLGNSPFPGIVILCEKFTSCPTPPGCVDISECPILLSDACEISDVLKVSAVTDTSSSHITLQFLSDNNTEAGPCWTAQEGGSCLPLGSFINPTPPGILGFTANAELPGGTNVIPPPCNFATVGQTHVSVCLNLVLISDGSGLSEVTDTTTTTTTSGQGVPEFGLAVPVLAVSAAALVALAIIRRRSFPNTV